jgi:hypothetical protein
MKTLTFMIICSIAFISCEYSGLSEIEMHYPMHIGNSWDYARTVKLVNVTADSIPDELVWAVDTSLASAWLSGKEVLNDTLETFVLKISGNYTNRVSEHYYLEKDDGLYIVAYKNAGAAPFILPKKSQRFHIKFKERIFNNIYEILRELEIKNQPALSKISDDSLIFEISPVLTLKYPIYITSHWTYRNSPWRIDKRVQDRVTVSAAGEKFDCYQIKWIYDIDDNGKWDDDLFIYDYVAEQGLIQRDIFVRGSIIVNMDGTEQGSFDYHDKMILQSYSIQ